MEAATTSNDHTLNQMASPLKQLHAMAAAALLLACVFGLALAPEPAHAALRPANGLSQQAVKAERPLSQGRGVGDNKRPLEQLEHPPTMRKLPVKLRPKTGISARRVSATPAAGADEPVGVGVGDGEPTAQPAAQARPAGGCDAREKALELCRRRRGFFAWTCDDEGLPVKDCGEESAIVQEDGSIE